MYLKTLPDFLQQQKSRERGSKVVKCLKTEREQSMEKRQRIEELVELLNKANYAYEQENREIMSNFEYDALYDELKALEEETGFVMAQSPTIKAGYEVLSELPKERHVAPMLSLDKTKDVDALAAFLGEKAGILSWKLDGLTNVITYNNGELVKALTRGNGEIGENITNNAKVYKNIPVKIPYKGELVLRGESIITYSEFERINAEIEDVTAKYKNPRNLCSGSVRQDLEFLEYLRTNNDGRHEAFLRWMRSRAADYRHHSSWRSAWSLYALLTYVGNSPGAQVESTVCMPDGSSLTLNRGVLTVSKLALNAPFAAQSGTVYAVLRAKAQPVQTDYPGITEKGLQMTRVYEKQGEDGIWRETKDFAVGDVVRVSLTCAKTREQELNHLVLEDYLPASMEALNPAVPSQAAGLEPLSWSEYFDHREYLADRVRGFCTRWPGRDAVNLRYYARVKRTGSATAPPAQAQLFYEPQTYGLSPSAKLETSAR